MPPKKQPKVRLPKGPPNEQANGQASGQPKIDETQVQPAPQSYTQGLCSNLPPREEPLQKHDPRAGTQRYPQNRSLFPLPADSPFLSPSIKAPIISTSQSQSSFPPISQMPSKPPSLSSWKPPSQSLFQPAPETPPQPPFQSLFQSTMPSQVQPHNQTTVQSMLQSPFRSPTPPNPQSILNSVTFDTTSATPVANTMFGLNTGPDTFDDRLFSRIQVIKHTVDDALKHQDECEAEVENLVAELRLGSGSAVPSSGELGEGQESRAPSSDDLVEAQDRLAPSSGHVDQAQGPLVSSSGDVGEAQGSAVPSSNDIFQFGEFSSVPYTTDQAETQHLAPEDVGPLQCVEALKENIEETIENTEQDHISSTACMILMRQWASSDTKHEIRAHEEHLQKLSKLDQLVRAKKFISARDLKEIKSVIAGDIMNTKLHIQGSRELGEKTEAKYDAMMSNAKKRFVENEAYHKMMAMHIFPNLVKSMGLESSVTTDDLEAYMEPDTVQKRLKGDMDEFWKCHRENLDRLPDE